MSFTPMSSTRKMTMLGLGFPSYTINSDVSLPKELVAVRVNWVVWLMTTSIKFRPVTSPTPWLMLRDVSLSTSQLSLTVSP